MSDINRDELFYSVSRIIAERDAIALGEDHQPDETPYIQEGDVEDVVSAFESLGYRLVKD